MAYIDETGLARVTTKLKDYIDEKTAGGGESTGDYWLKVIDYDGTILAEKNLNTGDTFDLSTVTLPTHDRLTFQEWSSSEEIVNNVVTCNDNNIMIGPVYETTSGLSEFDIELTKATGLTVTLNMPGNVDWGDGTSETISASTTHTYSDYDKYMITITAAQTVGSFDFAPKACVTNIRMGAGTVNLASNMFNNFVSLQTLTLTNSTASQPSCYFSSCRNLKHLTIPNRVTKLYSNFLSYCSSLQSVVIPKSVTNIGDYTFRNDSNLKYIAIPANIITIGNYFLSQTSIKKLVVPGRLNSNFCSQCSNLEEIKLRNSAGTTTYMFSGCYKLKEVTFPNSITLLGSIICNNCWSLKQIICEGDIVSIQSSAFSNCYTAIKYDFTHCTAVPTLANTDAFTGINALCKIIVPDSLYNTWIAATNWVTYADYIYKASEVQE